MFENSLSWFGVSRCSERRGGARGYDGSAASRLGEFAAYNATTGEKLWSFDTGLGIISAPMAYSIAGTQYISLLVGYGGSAGSGIPLFRHGWKFGLQPRRLLTFKLDGKEQLPPTPPPDMTVNPVVVEGFEPEAAKVNRGIVLYHTVCTNCHGGMLAAESVAPDLRESVLAANRDSFQAILVDGILAGRGMPLFDDLSPEDVESIYHYVRFGAMVEGGEEIEIDMDECTFCGIAN